VADSQEKPASRRVVQVAPMMDDVEEEEGTETFKETTATMARVPSTGDEPNWDELAVEAEGPLASTPNKGSKTNTSMALAIATDAVDLSFSEVVLPAQTQDTKPEMTSDSAALVLDDSLEDEEMV